VCLIYIFFDDDDYDDDDDDDDDVVVVAVVVIGVDVVDNIINVVVSLFGLISFLLRVVVRDEGQE